MDMLQFHIASMRSRDAFTSRFGIVDARTKAGLVLLLHMPMDRAQAVISAFNPAPVAPEAAIYSAWHIAQALHEIAHRASLMPGDLEVIAAAARLIRHSEGANV
jgi:hypothetical protein